MLLTFDQHRHYNEQRLDQHLVDLLPKIFSRNLILAMDGLAYLFIRTIKTLTFEYKQKYALHDCFLPHNRDRIKLTVVWPIGIMVLIDQFIYKILVFLRQLEMAHLERSHCIGGHYIFLDQFHLNDAISFGTVRRPILITFSSATLDLIKSFREKSEQLDIYPKITNGPVSLFLHSPNS